MAEEGPPGKAYRFVTALARGDIAHRQVAHRKGAAVKIWVTISLEEPWLRPSASANQTAITTESSSSSRALKRLNTFTPVQEITSFRHHAQ